LKKAFAVFVIILLVALSTTVVIVHNGLPAWQTKKFYVGVTNCGDSVEDAIQLINKVKDYTNLFVVQSALVNYNLTEIEQICDYAVNAGLNIIVYFGPTRFLHIDTAIFLNNAQTRWGEHFLGLYCGDELGGKMLDSETNYSIPNIGNITRNKLGFAVRQTVGSFRVTKRYQFSGEIIVFYYSAGTGNRTTYYTNGTILFEDFVKNENLFYYPNGTVAQYFSASDVQVVTDKGNISQFEPYQEVWDSRPRPTNEQLATAFVDAHKPILDRVHNQTDVNVFISDYALYWWDYLCGYDTIFAELGWNNTVAQEIGLVRGAAKLQDKSWGTIITWTYNHLPYLTTGEEMYNQMCTSYECGADYVIIFNYGEEMNSAYGTLQQEHFEALENFWNQVVESPMKEKGSTKASAVLVLPEDYGCGMRSPEDKIWGICDPDQNSEQIWNLLQEKLSEYGTQLDIVYDDTKYPVTDKYQNVCYWNQTN